VVARVKHRVKTPPAELAAAARAGARQQPKQPPKRAPRAPPQRRALMPPSAPPSRPPPPPSGRRALMPPKEAGSPRPTAPLPPMPTDLDVVEFTMNPRRFSKINMPGSNWKGVTREFPPHLRFKPGTKFQGNPCDGALRIVGYLPHECSYKIACCHAHKLEDDNYVFDPQAMLKYKTEQVISAVLSTEAGVLRAEDRVRAHGPALGVTAACVNPGVVVVTGRHEKVRVKVVDVEKANKKPIMCEEVLPPASRKRPRTIRVTAAELAKALAADAPRPRNASAAAASSSSSPAATTPTGRSDKPDSCDDTGESDGVAAPAAAGGKAKAAPAKGAAAPPPAAEDSSSSSDEDDDDEEEDVPPPKKTRPSPNGAPSAPTDAADDEPSDGFF